MTTTVYLLKKHTVGRHEWAWGKSDAYTVEGVYSDHATPSAIAKEKNKLAHWYTYTVQKKVVK